MQFSFDLISDLHIESWPDFDWSDKPTSPYCVVVGDVAQDRLVLIKTLAHLGNVYSGVFYIDGNHEHRHYIDNLKDSYQDLESVISKIPNVVYLRSNIVVINGVALLAVNGWWAWDFDNQLDFDQSIAWFVDKTQVSDTTIADITDCAYTDTSYLVNAVRKLQKHPDVEHIVIISHTVPAPELLFPDPDLVNTWRFNIMGNKHLKRALLEDTECKISTWCFGHYHRPVDQVNSGIRFVNNCRGHGDTQWRQTVFQPKRIEI
jgi:hypothetical protein